MGSSALKGARIELGPGISGEHSRPGCLPAFIYPSIPLSFHPSLLSSEMQ